MTDKKTDDFINSLIQNNIAFVISDSGKRFPGAEFSTTDFFSGIFVTNTNEYMPGLIKIRVECHSGYKADEYPKCFYWDDKRFNILEITDRWYHRGLSTEWPAADYFKVLTTDNKQCILKHELEKDQWYYVSEQTD